MKKLLSVSLVTSVLLLSACNDSKPEEKTKAAKTTKDIKKEIDKKVDDKKNHSKLIVGKSYPISKFNVALGETTFSNGFKLKATFGFGSAAYHNPQDSSNIVYIATDRGVNIKCKDSEEITGKEICKKGKIFPFPNFTPTIIKAELTKENITVKEIITLKDKDGKNISGVSNPLSNFTEIAYDIDGKEMAYDPNGLDVEALVKLSDGSFWVSDEYASSLVHVAKDGKIITRLVPKGLEGDLKDATYKVEGKLPAIIAKRHANRGIESVAISPDEQTLYFCMQSPLDNPSYKTTNKVRLYSMNLSDYSTKEYLYVMDAPDTFVKDNETKKRIQKDVKISEMLALPSGELLVLERISATTKLYKIDLANATEVPSDKSEDLETNDFTTSIVKTKVFDTETRPETFPNKLEGVAYLGDNKFFMINDNDFGIEGDDGVAQVIELDTTKTPVKKDIPGHIVFFNTNGDFNSSVKVGILPDMVKFTHDGKKVLVANEGQPVGEEGIEDVYYDPYGTVSIVDVETKEVTTLDFSNVSDDTGMKRKKNTEISRDAEPEYIAVSEDDKSAWVSLQELNAIAKINLETNTLSKVFGLGFKDLSLAKNTLDYKKDKKVSIETTPDGVYGMYQPDTIATYKVNGVNYVVTANEGDDRDDFYDETTKASKLTHSSIPDIGDVRVNPDIGDENGDGDYEKLYTYGARSFSIFNGDSGELVYDSGNDFETTVAADINNSYFNTRPKKGKWYGIDERSEKKGVEPEALNLAHIDGKVYAYIGLEKQGGFFAYDITNPSSVSKVEYFNDINYSKAYDKESFDSPAQDTAYMADIDDMAPEGSVTFTQDSKNYLCFANEVSGSVSIFELADDGKVTKKDTFRTGIYKESAAEIVDYDSSTKRLFVTNTSQNTIMILDASDVTNLTKVKDIDLSSYGTGVNSVSVGNGMIAVAVERKE